MPRALWKGTVAFGLVEIPVALHSAETSADEIRFTLIDRRDFSPVGYERVSKRTGQRVPWEEIVRGYEHEKGEFVVLTDGELKAASPEKTQTIDIVDFVDAAEIDSVYWETPYYLEPVKKAKSRSYALLRETLARGGRVAIAKVVIRTRQRLAALAVRGDVIVLNVLRYAHELRDPGDLDLPKGSAKDLGLSEKEIAMAERLVAGMAAKWDPDAYRDDYREDVLALVERKVRAGKTKEVETPGKAARAPARHGEVLDLMPLLEKSLERRRPGAAQREPRRATTATTATTRTVAASRKRTPPRTARRKRA